MEEEFGKKLLDAVKNDKELREELKSVISDDSSINTNSGKEKTIDRRDFLKKLGVGALGLGAATLIPSATGFEINSEQGLTYINSKGNKSFSIDDKTGVLTASQIGTSDNRITTINSQSINTNNSLNNIGTPRPDDNGEGIRKALKKYDTVALQPGTYIIDEPLELENHRLKGAGNRGQTILKASSKFPSNKPLLKSGGPKDSDGDGKLEFGDETPNRKPFINRLEIECNGYAQDGLLLDEGVTDWAIREVSIYNAYRDGFRMIGSFNGIAERIDIRNCRRAAIVIGDNKSKNTNSYRASAIKLSKCHIQTLGESHMSEKVLNHIPTEANDWQKTIGILWGSGKYNPFDTGDENKYNEAAVGTSNCQINHCDIKKCDVGIYMGQGANESTIIRGDVEGVNDVGFKIGSSKIGSELSYKPRDITIVGSTFSGQQNYSPNYAYEINSGSNIALINITESGADPGNGLYVAPNYHANGPILDFNSRVDNGKQIAPYVDQDANIITIGSNGYRKSSLELPNIKIRSKDLTSFYSSGKDDYMHNKELSNSYPEGLYRGDGNNPNGKGGGWLKVSDNSVKINTSEISN